MGTLPNNFIDESIMNKHGEPVEYVPVKSDFAGSQPVRGLEVTELTWEDAGHYFDGSKANGLPTPTK